LETPRLLDAQYVHWPFDQADLLVIPPGVRAEPARLAFRQSAADFAE
jgi:hypothetical protein